MAAGVQSYYAFLRGKRVTYLGRAGDEHVEWFPGAKQATDVATPRLRLSRWPPSFRPSAGPYRPSDPSWLPRIPAATIAATARATFSVGTISMASHGQTVSSYGFVFFCGI